MCKLASSLAKSAVGMSLRAELIAHGLDASEERIVVVLAFLGSQELTCVADFEGMAWRMNKCLHFCVAGRV